MPQNASNADILKRIKQLARLIEQNSKNEAVQILAAEVQELAGDDDSDASDVDIVDCCAKNLGKPRSQLTKTDLARCIRMQRLGQLDCTDS